MMFDTVVYLSAVASCCVVLKSVAQNLGQAVTSVVRAIWGLLVSDPKMNKLSQFRKVNMKWGNPPCCSYLRFRCKTKIYCRQLFEHHKKSHRTDLESLVAAWSVGKQVDRILEVLDNPYKSLYEVNGKSVLSDDAMGVSNTL